MEQCWLNFVFMSKPVKVALIKGEGGNVVSFRVETYKIYKRQDKADINEARETCSSLHRRTVTA